MATKVILPLVPPLPATNKKYAVFIFLVFFNFFIDYLSQFNVIFKQVIIKYS